MYPTFPGSVVKLTKGDGSKDEGWGGAVVY